MDKTQTIQNILSLLEKEHPEARTALRFRTPHQLLVATILSAQCTDARVNLVTVPLFRKYANVRAFARASLEEFEQDIRCTGFYRNKAKYIIAASRMIVEEFGGRVPDTMESLLTLPGVARKTANVVLAEAYGKQEGIAVDTHVIRLSRRLGLTTSVQAERIERDLMALAPRSQWGRLSNLLILHGRQTCGARRPRCSACCLRQLCPSHKEK